MRCGLLPRGFHTTEPFATVIGHTPGRNAALVCLGALKAHISEVE